MKKKIAAVTQIALLLVYAFSFSYFFSQLTLENSAQEENTQDFILLALKIILNSLKSPMIQIVSAQDSLDTGCCEVTRSNDICAVSTRGLCKPGARFAKGALCKDTSFCKKGCCYDGLGNYIPGVAKISCKNKWYPDANCNLPQAELGCCILGESSVRYLTKEACENAAKGLGNKNLVEWKKGLSEVQCSLLTLDNVYGACITAGNECRLTTGKSCALLRGDFYQGLLCTNKKLNTTCKMTEKTSCFEGLDEVFFVDSCGQRANIYDSSRAKDPSYWQKIIPKLNSCNPNSDNGNANSKSCGNCQRFSGGVCANAKKEGFAPDMGDYYCKPTSCSYKGKEYRSGESWCVYDGSVGMGRDVVGSRHFVYSCINGEIQVEPCSDYRKGVCLQSKTQINGETANQARCFLNGWKTCANYNKNKEGLSKCKSDPNCRIQRVDIADKFSFDYCVPKFPPGLDIKGKYSKSSRLICSQATQTCKVIRKGKFWGGGCKIVANAGCLEKKFAEKMNDLCISLGDCGGSANILGKFEKNYKIKNSPDLSQEKINELISYASPDGSFVEPEMYDSYLNSLGMLEDPRNEPNRLFSSSTPIALSGSAGAVYLIASQVGLLTASSLAPIFSSGGAVIGSLFGPKMSSFLGLVGDKIGSALTTGPSFLGAFSAVTIGALSGASAAIYLARILDVSPGGTLLMTIGGASSGGAATYSAIFGGNLLSLSVLGIAFWAGVLLVFIGTFFKAKKCDPIEVRFECKPWQPPKGGSDCDKCGKDSKPCTKYRCESLGASCKFIDEEGEKYDICFEQNPNDASPPKISALKPLFGDEKYSDIKNTGFRIESKDGSCIKNPPKLISINFKTDEPAQCRYSLEKLLPFDEMEDFAGNNYKYNHSMPFPLIDPSHGKSRGLNWTGNLKIFIKCQDTRGNENQYNYIINGCVEQGEDKLAPAATDFNPKNNSLVSFDLNEKIVQFRTNEPARCRYSKNNTAFDKMENPFNCTDVGLLSSVCSANIKTPSNKTRIFIKCKDQPWLEEANQSEKRNENKEAIVFVLRKPKEKIKIDSINPKGEIRINSRAATISINVTTSKGSGESSCKYSFSGFESSTNPMIPFLNSKGNFHSQPGLNLYPRIYNLYVLCEDSVTGDTVGGISEFEIIRDVSFPKISRISLKDGISFETSKTALCRYSTSSCSFLDADSNSTNLGKFHKISPTVKGKTYYIRCEDEFGNGPSKCNLAVVAI